jgi:radical SAM protein with 4Fe4S-binding SPASM domain
LNIIQSIKTFLQREHRDSMFYKFFNPDYVEERNDRILLIWGDKPFWTVVDREFYEILLLLDGKSHLSTVIDMKSYPLAKKMDIIKGINLLKNNGVIIDHETVKNETTKEAAVGIPIENIALNLTRSCNLYCKTCYNHEEKPRDKFIEIPSEDIVKALKAIKPFLSKKATLTVLGGEPLLFEEKLLHICEEAVNLGLKVIVSTNGMDISDNFSKAAARLKVEIQVSLDGHNSELNDNIRGIGTFDKAVANIKRLVQNDVYTIISLVCHQGNVDYLQEFYRFALSLGVKEARFIPLKLMGSGKSGTLKPIPLTELMTKAHRVFKNNKDLQRLFGRDCYSILCNTCYFSLKNTSCGTGLKTLLLDSDGAVYPCANTAIEEFYLGNINDISFDFEKLWLHSQKLKSFRKRTNIDSMNGICPDCPVRRWCLGGCRGETVSVNKDLSIPVYNCEDMRQAIIETFWILTEREEAVTKVVSKC